MPPTRRTRNSGGPIAKGGQKALSFNQTKNTKPTVKDLEKEKSVSSDISPVAPTTIDVGHVSSEAAVAQQAAAEVSKPEPTKEEIEAAGVTDAQIRRYWKAREAERRTPRLHQEGLGVEEKILRLWDMSSQYGVRFTLLLFILPHDSSQQRGLISMAFWAGGFFFSRIVHYGLLSITLDILLT